MLIRRLLILSLYQQGQDLGHGQLRADHSRVAALTRRTL
jgi:hypothetical protein